MARKPIKMYNLFLYTILIWSVPQSGRWSFYFKTYDVRAFSLHHAIHFVAVELHLLCEILLLFKLMLLVAFKSRVSFHAKNATIFILQFCYGFKTEDFVQWPIESAIKSVHSIFIIAMKLHSRTQQLEKSIVVKLIAQLAWRQWARIHILNDKMCFHVHWNDTNSIQWTISRPIQCELCMSRVWLNKFQKLSTK